MSALFKKQKSRLAKVLSIFILLALGGGARYAYLAVYPPGYCRAQHRYIPDDEYLKASIALLYWDMNRITTTYPEGRKVKKKDIYYKGIDFDPKNPNCFFVTRGQETVIDQLLGRQTVFVFLNPRTSKGPVTSMGDSFYDFDYSDCGELLSSGISLPDSNTGTISIANYRQIIKK
ncbi:MAG TPA: hypothetical protein VKC56_04065 [Gallionellaceae bacterium]|nr:hypothetical protein [Gallionellaceae bacterium]